jgi:hypothetical protein
MIQFPCTCGRVFLVEEDQAGGTIQCPVCRKLNDIPLLSDLAGLAEDGTFRMTGPAVASDPDRLGELVHIYHGGRQDHEGDDIDLRNTQEELADVGVEYDLKTRQPLQLPHGPRYDPETGELVREIEVKHDPVRDAPAVPAPGAAAANASKVIGYRSGPVAKQLDEDRVTPGKIPFALFRPVNVFVMFVIFIEHVLLNITLLAVLSGIAFLLVAPAVLVFFLLAHYGCVVDEIGPEDRDELPRPLRQLGWGEDLWGPFSGTMGAVVLCYLPLFIILPAAIATQRLTSLPVVLAMGAFALGGSFFFPAVLLTTMTSGTPVNLTPGRVMGVIGHCGAAYVGTVGLYLAAIVTYGLAVVGSLAWLVQFLGVDLGMGILGSALFAHLTLIIAVYLMHLFCWRVGLLYRAHHEQFPWVFQFHVRTARGAPSPNPSKPAAAGAQVAGTHAGGPAQGRQFAPAPTNAPVPNAAQQRQAQIDALQAMQSRPAVSAGRTARR